MGFPQSTLIRNVTSLLLKMEDGVVMKEKG